VLSAWVRDAARPTLALEVLAQPSDRYGTGAAVLAAREWVGDEPFVMAFGDILTGRPSYPKLSALHRSHPTRTILSVWPVPVVDGGLVTVERGVVTAIVEKPHPPPVGGGLINAGVFVLQPSVFEDLALLRPSPRGEYELTDVFRWMLDRGDPPMALELTDYWSNLTDPRELLDIERTILDQDEAARGVTPASRSTGDIRAETVGPVAVSSSAVLGSARIGPYVSLGAGASVADGAQVRNAAVFSGARVEADARVEYAVVGENAVVAAGEVLRGTAASPAVRVDG